jgi:hypothetical protein
VATWVEELPEKYGAPGVKQQLAAVRMLFDWLITVQIVPTNPAAAVRGPKYVVTTGKTPVLDGVEWRRLLNAIPTETVRDLRDRALIGTLTYSFARVGAALKLKVEDLPPNGSGWQIYLHERRQGTQDALPSHVIGNAARLCCRGRHRRGSQGLAVPCQSGQQRDCADRTADEPISGMVHGSPAGGRGRHRCSDRQSHVQGDGNYEFSGERRHARARAGHGRARPGSTIGGRNASRRLRGREFGCDRRAAKSKKFAPSFRWANIEHWIDDHHAPRARTFSRKMPSSHIPILVMIRRDAWFSIRHWA